jgi:hypothetical protein
VLAASAFALHLATRPTSGELRERAGRVTSTRWVQTQAKAGYDLVDLKLLSSSGLTVRCRIRVPESGNVGVRYPAYVIAGGVKTGRHAVNFRRMAVPDVVMIACDYPLNIRKLRETSRFWRALPQLRRAFIDAPATLVLATDYLTRRPDVDSGAIAMIGASFGVPAATVAAALDTRIRAAAFLYGGGDLPLLLVQNVDLGSAAANRVGRALAWLLARPIEPTRHAGAIAPRPTLMVNSPTDSAIPRASIDELYAALREPKELRWVPLEHFAAFHERELLAELTKLVTEWLRTQGFGQAEPAARKP